MLSNREQDCLWGAALQVTDPDAALYSSGSQEPTRGNPHHERLTNGPKRHGASPQRKRGLYSTAGASGLR